MKKLIALGLVALLAACAETATEPTEPGTIQAPSLSLEGVPTPVDLNSWTAESYPAVSGFDPGVWTVSTDGYSVLQSVNGQPTLFYSDFDVFNTEVEGAIAVITTDDNDYIGFALGFQPGDASNADADYLLIDWKQGNQWYDFLSPSCTPGSWGYAGLAVSRVSGIPTADEFWGHENFNALACSDLSNGLDELARGTNLGTIGWADNTQYNFKFEYSATSLKVYVNDVLEIDIAGDFPNGRIAFYNFSQAEVEYNSYVVVVVNVGIDIKPGSYPNCFNNNGNGVIPVAILGSETFDVSQIDPATVVLEGMAVKTVGKANKLLAHIEDVSGPEGVPDGFPDLVVQIQDEDGVFEPGAGTATVTGSLFDGRSFEGSDEICLVPPSDVDGDGVRDDMDCDPTVPNTGTYEGHTYMVCQGQKNFEAATTACTDAGFDLAYIDTEAENTWVVDLAVGTYGLVPWPDESTTYWIANRKTSPPQTTWPSGNPVWAAGEPSGDGDYIQLIRYYNQPYGWNDVPPTWDWGWVCESP